MSAGPLQVYARKRNFRATPEPSGRKHAGRKGGLTFVVQKHRASHLHYDFRLEAGGVLKSWAVPKGIPESEGEKRLAVMVEDHPLEYRRFHGAIPAGSYGAGTVEIWDEGRYTSGGSFDRGEDEELVARGLSAGHLDIIIDGHRLRGAYTLVRFKRTGGRNWLLIKKSGEAVRALSREQGAMPEAASLRPMLAASGGKPGDRRGWLFEVKWDGYRALAEIRGGSARLYSRSGREFGGRFPALIDSLSRVPNDALLDGEIVAVGKYGAASFQLLQNYLETGRGQLLYFVFDILYAGGSDLRSLPLVERKKILSRTVPDLPRVKINPYVEEKGGEFFAAALRQGFEGVMAKAARSVYRAGERSAEWQKIKAVRRQEAVIGGFTEPSGARNYFGALVLGVYAGGELTYIGHAGGGFDEKTLARLYRLLKERVTDISPFSIVPATNTPVTWVRPELVCEVKFAEWTRDGRMRQPVFLGLRDDKDAREVVREEGAAATRSPLPAKKDASPPRTAREPVPKPRYTNLGKIFWPREGYTKGDVIAYYDTVAPVMLPYLAGRPENLRRHPDGIEGASFVQRDVSGMAPPWAATVAVDQGNGERLRSLICQDRETLLYMANLGCIEINPWNSRLGSLDTPDYLVLDFDPVDVAFDRVIEAVLAARAVLEAADAPAWCKTSGAAGMHVFVPLGARYTFEQVENFAQVIAAAVNRLLPGATSLVRLPGARRGKVYLDYLQNRRAQSVAAPYAVRPVPGASVSTPLRWDEVGPGLDPRSFTLRTIPARLEQLGDLWSGVLGPGIDMQRCLDRLEEWYGDARGSGTTREAVMAKYGEKAKKTVGREMHEYKHGKLKSGKSGKPVKSRKQAVAIGLSEARKKGARVPPRRRKEPALA